MKIITDTTNKVLEFIGQCAEPVFVRPIYDLIIGQGSNRTSQANDTNSRNRTLGAMQITSFLGGIFGGYLFYSGGTLCDFFKTIVLFQSTHWLVWYACAVFCIFTGYLAFAFLTALADALLFKCCHAVIPDSPV